MTFFSHNLKQVPMKTTQEAIKKNEEARVQQSTRRCQFANFVLAERKNR